MEVNDIGPWEDALQLPPLPQPPQANRVIIKPVRARAEPARPVSDNSVMIPVRTPRSIVKALPLMDSFTSTLTRMHQRPRKHSTRAPDSPVKSVAIEKVNLLISPIEFVVRARGRDTAKTLKARKSEAPEESPGHTRVDSDVLSYWGVTPVDATERVSAMPGKIPRVADLEGMRGGRFLSTRVESPSRLFSEFEALRRGLRFRHSKQRSLMY